MEHQEEIESRIAILAYLPEEVSSIVKKVKEDTQTSYPNHETQTPHITLYSCKFDQVKFPDLIQQIKDLEIKPFSVVLGEVEFTKLNKGSENLFAAISFKNEIAPRDLHEKVLLVGNQLRGNLVRAKDVERSKKGIYSQELFSFIEKYGYEHVREKFHPHITIGEVDIDDTQKIDQIKQLLRLIAGKEFVINKIHVLLSTRAIPSEKKVKESEIIEINL